MRSPASLDDDLDVGFDKKFTQPGITTRFNAALIAFHAMTGLLTFVTARPTRIDSLDGIIVSTALDLIRYLVVVLVTGWFVGEFWGRFVSRISAIRPIRYEEAVALVLILGLLLGR